MNVLVYIDALPLDSVSLERTPFIRKLLDQGYNYKLQNIMGYSFAIQSTILSGYLPSQTKLWMPYVHTKNSNVYGFKAAAPLARRIKIDVSRSRLLRTMRYGMNKFILRKGAGVNSISWSIADKFYVYPYYYMNELPAFIELERELRTVYETRLEYFGPALQKSGATDHAIRYIKSLSAQRQQFSNNTLLVVYVDVLDHRGHGYGLGSPIWNSTLVGVDHKMRELHSVLSEVVGNFTFSIFSDHGMSNIENTIDIMKILRLMGLDWRKITTFVDATIVNIWLEKQNPSSLQKALKRVSQDRFIVFNKEEDIDVLREVGVPLEETCTGDLIIQARPGYMFYPNSYSDIKCFKGAHGYFPDEICQQSFLNTSINAEKDLGVNPIHIKDIRKFVLSLVMKNPS